MLRLAEHAVQKVPDELLGRVLVIVEDEPNRLGVGENVTHEMPPERNTK
jgi:hypothetical protein